MGSWSYENPCVNCDNQSADWFGDSQGNSGQDCLECGLNTLWSSDGNDIVDWRTLESVNEERVECLYIEPLESLREGKYERDGGLNELVYS